MTIRQLLIPATIAVFLAAFYIAEDQARSRGDIKEAFSGTFCEQVVRDIREEDPELFSVGERDMYKGKPAIVLFGESRFPGAENFRARIQDAASGGADFAGHFAVATWGCGSNCRNSAIIDVRSGNIVMFGIGSMYGVSYKKDDRLFVVNPVEEVPDVNLFDFNDIQLKRLASSPREYYVLRENPDGPVFEKLCTESAAAHLEK